MHIMGTYYKYKIRSDNEIVTYFFLCAHNNVRFVLTNNILYYLSYYIIVLLPIYDTNERRRERDAVCACAGVRRVAHLYAAK